MRKNVTVCPECRAIFVNRKRGGCPKCGIRLAHEGEFFTEDEYFVDKKGFTYKITT
jgi:hypothetical protein